MPLRPPLVVSGVLACLLPILLTGPVRGDDIPPAPATPPADAPPPAAPPAVETVTGTNAPPLPVLRTTATTMDSRRRFAVHGGAADERAELITWATTTAERFERYLHVKLPWPVGATYHLNIVHEKDAPAGLIAWQEAARDAPWQHLTLVNPEHCSLFELTVAFVRHLLVRVHYDSAQAEQLIAAADRLPYWYVAGQARAMLPEYRSADAQVVVRKLREDEWPSPDRLLAARGASDLDSDEQAALTMWVRWLKEQPAFATVERAAWAAASEGPVNWDAARLGTYLDPPRTARAVCQDWDLYLTGLRHLTLPRELNTRDLAFELRRVLSVPRAYLPPPIPPTAPELITPLSLVRFRDKPWARALAAHMRDSLLYLPIAQDPRAVDVARAHAELLDILSRPAARSVWKWITIEPDEAELTGRALFADHALKALETAPVADPASHPKDSARAPVPDAP